VKSKSLVEKVLRRVFLVCREDQIKDDEEEENKSVRLE